MWVIPYLHPPIFFRFAVPPKYRINIIHVAHDGVVNFRLGDTLEPQEPVNVDKLSSLQRGKMAD